MYKTNEHSTKNIGNNSFLYIKTLKKKNRLT